MEAITPARAVGRPRTSPVPEGYDSPENIATRRAYMAAYKAANAERLKAYYREWRAANPEKHRQYNREWTVRDRVKRAQLIQPPIEVPAYPSSIPLASAPESHD